MKEKMLSSMPGVSSFYGELVLTMWDGLILLLRIIETYFYSIWILFLDLSTAMEPLV